MADTEPRDEELAAALAVAVKRLRARFRAESSFEAAGLTTPQMSVLHRLITGGPTTAAALAAAEHVSDQAIAQTIAPLKTRGLVTTERDPSDRRKTLIGISDEGLALRDYVLNSRRSWLASAMRDCLTAEDRAVLARAVELLERLVDA